MICERCGESDATVQYVDIVEGQKTAVWLCEACARAEGVAASLDDDNAVPEEAEGLASFVGGLLAGKTAAPATETAEEPQLCPECGFSSTQLEERGVLGCPACYAVFRPRVLPLLERYHRGLSHVGKTPHADGPRAALRRELADLRTALERAVAAESYEAAAHLRDRIRARERELARLAAPGDEASPPDEKTAEP